MPTITPPFRPPTTRVVANAAIRLEPGTDVFALLRNLWGCGVQGLTVHTQSGSEYRLQMGRSSTQITGYGTAGLICRNVTKARIDSDGCLVTEDGSRAGHGRYFSTSRIVAATFGTMF